MLVFEERGKPEFPEKNLSEQSREPTNSAHIWRRVRESNPGHIGGRRALSPLHQPCSRTPTLLPKKICFRLNRYSTSLVPIRIAFVPFFQLWFKLRRDVGYDRLVFSVFRRLHWIECADVTRNSAIIDSFAPRECDVIKTSSFIFTEEISRGCLQSA